MWGWLSFTLYCCCPRQGLKGNKISLYTDSLVNGLNFRMGMSVCWIQTDRKRLGDFKKDISAIIIIQQHVENNGLQYRFCVRLDAVSHDDQQIATDIWFWLVHFPQHLSLWSTVLFYCNTFSHFSCFYQVPRGASHIKLWSNQLHHLKWSFISMWYWKWNLIRGHFQASAHHYSGQREMTRQGLFDGLLLVPLWSNEKMIKWMIKQKPETPPLSSSYLLLQHVYIRVWMTQDRRCSPANTHLWAVTGKTEREGGRDEEREVGLVGVNLHVNERALRPLCVFCESVTIKYIIFGVWIYSLCVCV